MKPTSTLRSFLLGYALLATSTAFAADAAWNVDLDGSWSTNANWTAAAPGATSGTTSTDVATFGTVITAARAITVDANRNISGINFNANSFAYTLSGGNLLLTNGGTIQTSGAGSAHTNAVASPIEIQGDGGAATFTGGSSTSTRLLSITGGVTGVSTGSNVTTLTLNGSNTGANEVGGGIADGAGGGKLALVKDGSGAWVLSTANNTYSGGTTINAGQLTISTNGRLGDSNGGITFGGSARLLVSANNVDFPATRTVTLNSGVASMGDNNINAAIIFTINGKITGAGGAQFGHYSQGSGTTNLTNTANDFTGPLILGRTAAFGNWLYSTFTLNIASLADGVGNGNIIFGQGNNNAGNTATLAWSDSATSALTLNNRRIELDTTVETSVLANNNTDSTRTITVNTNLLVSRAGNKVFGLGGTNTGTNTFSTVITDSVTPAATISLTKSGAGRWILTNANTYTGVTTVSGGVLVLNNANALPGGIGTTGGTSGLTFSGGVIGLATGDFTRSLGAAGVATACNFTGGGGWAAYGADRNVNLGGAGATIIWADANTGFNAQNLNLAATSATHKVTLVNGLDLGTATRTVTVSNGAASIDAELSGVITGGVGGALTKAGGGLLSLSNANTYSGTTTVSAGLLKLDNATAIPGGLGATGSSNVTITGGGIVGLTAASGDFLRARGNGGAAVQWTGSGGGGFAAFGGDRTVNLGGAGATAQWNTGSFVPASQPLILSSTISDGTVIWQNPINFAGSVRTVQVNNGSAAVDARLNGALSGGTTSGIDKTGAGTLELTNTSNSYSGATTVSAGTLRLGASDVLPNTTNVTIAAATVQVGAGFTDTVGTLDVTGNATINLGDGSSKLVFADSYGVDWSDIPGTLNITGTFVSGSSLKFGDGTPGTGLNGAQLAAITINGVPGSYSLDGSGYLVTGAGPGPLDHFAISAISSPQTVGTPITGITLTAQDASNATVTSFTGTVTFSGTGGFTGTSASFTAGVLSGVSVTPTVAGSGLTFIVTDGVSGKTGSATITTIQTQYQAWASGAAFDADANGDGVENGLAFLLGAASPTSSVTLPTVTQSAGDLTLTFSMRNAAKRGAASLNVQHSSDLGITDAWASALVPESTQVVSGVTFTITGGDPTNGVVATIPASGNAAAGKLFGRLKAQP